MGHRVCDTECVTQSVGHRVWDTECVTQSVGHRVWDTECVTQSVGHISNMSSVYNPSDYQDLAVIVSDFIC